MFEQLGLILLLSAILGCVALFLRQPILIAFIAVGIVCGPGVLNVIEHSETIDMLAKVGVSLLLFVVGLKLDIQTVQTMGRVALATGLGQVFVTSVAGFFICLALGIDAINSIYIAVALTFSSTIIIVKLLSDKKEIDSLHGRIAVGFLIVQDLVVVLVMLALAVFGGAGAESDSLALSIGALLIKAGLLLAIWWCALKFAFPFLLPRLARSSELLVLSSIAWAVALALLAKLLGFSEEVGAFLGGMSLASSEFREAILARLVSIRDFLLLFFFVSLGSSLDLSLLTQEISPALILSAFVLIGNPIIVMVIMGYMGYRKRTGLLAGLTVAQISEFSLIFVALGHSLGHVNDSSLAVVTLVGIITISLSTYLILYSGQLYKLLNPVLTVFERRQPFAEARFDDLVAPIRPRIIVFGLGRFGIALFRELSNRQGEVMGYDFDPETVAKLASEKKLAYYGDAQDAEFIAQLPLESAKWIICAVPDVEVNRALADTLRKLEYKGRIALTVYRDEDRALIPPSLYDELLSPFNQAASEVAGRFGQHPPNS